MSITERRDDDSLYALPRFELQCHLDDIDDPTEVTVFADTRTVELATQWISVDAGSAVSLEDVR
ncbi:hypothetical protein ACFO0N_05760 [Halobium salinum]|uniref:DUF7511 domain-containing protein n=1 Tax=Halobium salinum TaxID=1364940 RepID=A0ABD5P9A6_9EURY|nr:hypothetical protein [Halobium salinum]